MSEQVSSQKQFITSQVRLDGILYPWFVTPEAHEKAKTMPTRPDDIILACYPKSGTHWLLKILTLLINNGDDKYINYTPQLFKDFHWPQAAAIPGN